MAAGGDHLLNCLDEHFLPNCNHELLENCHDAHHLASRDADNLPLLVARLPLVQALEPLLTEVGFWMDGMSYEDRRPRP